MLMSLLNYQEIAFTCETAFFFGFLRRKTTCENNSYIALHCPTARNSNRDSKELQDIIRKGVSEKRKKKEKKLIPLGLPITFGHHCTYA